MDQVIKMLVTLFDEKGMTEDEISNCITSLWSIFSDPNVKCCEDLNLEMEEAGWKNIELNEETFKIASSVLAI